MKIIVRVTDAMRIKPPDGDYRKRFQKAFLCGVASAYDWSGNAGKIFIDSQMALLKDIAHERR